MVFQLIAPPVVWAGMANDVLVLKSGLFVVLVLAASPLPESGSSFSVPSSSSACMACAHKTFGRWNGRSGGNDCATGSSARFMLRLRGGWAGVKAGGQGNKLKNGVEKV